MTSRLPFVTSVQRSTSALIAKYRNIDLADVDVGFHAGALSVSYSQVLMSSSSRVVLCKPSQDGLVLEKPADANPDRFLLRYDFKRSLV
jgi:hypothetical protein